MKHNYAISPKFANEKSKFKNDILAGSVFCIFWGLVFCISNIIRRKKNNGKRSICMFCKFFNSCSSLIWFFMQNNWL